MVSGQNWCRVKTLAQYWKDAARAVGGASQGRSTRAGGSSSKSRHGKIPRRHVHREKFNTVRRSKTARNDSARRSGLGRADAPVFHRHGGYHSESRRGHGPGPRLSATGNGITHRGWAHCYSITSSARAILRNREAASENRRTSIGAFRPFRKLCIVFAESLG